MAKERKMDARTLSDEELQDMFEESFEEGIALDHNIGSFECTCEREPMDANVRMKVLIVGLAGSPSVDDYKNNKELNTSTVGISRADKGALTFKVKKQETKSLNTNDYIVIYESI